MSMMQELINQIAGNVIQTFLAVIVAYIGIVGKRLYQKYVNTKLKKIVVKDCVKAVEQIYKDIHGDDKKAQCENRIVQLLYEYGITITQAELDIMIESAVQELNKTLKDDKTIEFKK
jgi:phosphopantetheine adenylyltransferase